MTAAFIKTPGYYAVEAMPVSAPDFLISGVSLSAGYFSYLIL